MLRSQKVIFSLILITLFTFHSLSLLCACVDHAYMCIQKGSDRQSKADCHSSALEWKGETGASNTALEHKGKETCLCKAKIDSAAAKEFELAKITKTKPLFYFTDHSLYQRERFLSYNRNSQLFPNLAVLPLYISCQSLLI